MRYVYVLEICDSSEWYCPSEILGIYTNYLAAFADASSYVQDYCKEYGYSDAEIGKILSELKIKSEDGYTELNADFTHFWLITTHHLIED